MMLSATAARMGSVSTSLKQIGFQTRQRFSSVVASGVLGSNNSNATSSVTRLGRKQHQRWVLAAHPGATTDLSDAGRHWKSTLATYDSSSDEEDSIPAAAHNYDGHAEAAMLRAATDQQGHEESWTISMGRNGDNEWLLKPRDPDHWFTGLKPSVCPGVDTKGVIRSLPLPNLSAVTRASAREYFDNSWTLYETLFAGLKGEEGFYRPPPHGLRHPQIFYYGHTACLYVNKLRVSGVLPKPVNAYFESIFEVGVDEMLWDDMDKNEMLWPAVSEVHEYREQVYKIVVDAIENHPALDDSNGPVSVNQDHPMWALFMGFEHERIHMETSSVLFRETPYHLVQKPENWPPIHPSANEGMDSVTSNPIEGVHYPSNRMLPVKKDTVDLGKPADFPSYGWDNEYGERSMEVPDFEASEHMITNGEYWQFVNEGGYRKKEFWCEDGWAWRTHRNLKWPFFWESAGPAGSHEYALRTIFKIVPMPWNWPVDVTYYESKAFCRWRAEQDGLKEPYRLLTEAEHHVIRHEDHNLEAARKTVSADKVMANTGESFPEGSTGSNLNMAYGSQNPVDYFAPSHTGHRDVTGNAWEWTEDHFNPLKGFEVHHVYDDFSSPCFDGKHSMIVGGSFMSTGDEASVFARFHFRPHFLQHSGFRLVTSDEKAPATHLFAGNFGGQKARSATEKDTATEMQAAEEHENVYETSDSLHMYLGLHYPTSGDKEGISPILAHTNSPEHGVRFPQRVANLLTSLEPARTNNSALDMGCAVGGASFQLAQSFDKVDAFDFSASFVNTAKQMQTEENIRFQIPVEAELFHEVQAVHEDGVTADVRGKVNFFTGDACKLNEMKEEGTLNTYDGVIMANLLCRLPNPMACLNALPNIVNEGGVVVMVTPFSWLTEFTPRSKWLGGFYDPVSKDPIRSKDVLKEVMLARGFEKIHEEEMPLVIREHQRKYQYIISEATGWRKVN